MTIRVICPKCGYTGWPGRKKRGSTKIELVGWLLLFPLGIPYTIWRLVTKFPVCKECGHETLIDAESMVGRKLIAKQMEEFKDIELPPRYPEKF